MELLKVLITVKTYPIPSAKYDELVCTAGVSETGDFVRLYPVNFRDLPYSQQYTKYQWIQVSAQRHSGRDTRKESYRPDCETLKKLGEPIPTCDSPGLSDIGGDRIMVSVGGPKDERVTAGSAASLAAV